MCTVYACTCYKNKSWKETSRCKVLLFDNPEEWWAEVYNKGNNKMEKITGNINLRRNQAEQFELWIVKKIKW